MESFDGATWHRAGPLEIERMSLVLGTVAEAAAAAVEAMARFRTVMADQQPAEAGDDWAR